MDSKLIFKIGIYKTRNIGDQKFGVEIYGIASKAYILKRNTRLNQI